MSRRQAHARLSYNVADQSGIKGREKEVAVLEKLYKNCGATSKVLLVEGKAGTGKTLLIANCGLSKFLEQGYYVSGKFQLQRKDEPFSAIADAFTELLQDILSSSKHEANRMKSEHNTNNNNNGTKHQPTKGGTNNNKKPTLATQIMTQFYKESAGDRDMQQVLASVVPKFQDLCDAAHVDEPKEKKRPFAAFRARKVLKKNNKGGLARRTQKMKESFSSVGSKGSTHSKGSLQSNSGDSEDDDDDGSVRIPSRSMSGVKQLGWNFEKLKIALRLLLRCVCRPNRKVVMFLDDLQYADQSSLDLIEFLASHEGINQIASEGGKDDSSVKSEKESSEHGGVQGFFLVLAYRTERNEAHTISEKHPFRARMKELRQSGCAIHRIGVKELDLDATHELIRHVLRRKPMDDDDMALATVIYKKTGGNPFFILQTLQFCEHEKLIFFDTSCYAWRYGAVSSIQSATNLSDNIVGVVATRLKELPPTTLEILKLGSCLGTYFRLEVLAAYFRKYHSKGKEKIDFATAAAEAVSEEDELNRSMQLLSSETMDGNASMSNSLAMLSFDMSMNLNPAVGKNVQGPTNGSMSSNELSMVSRGRGSLIEDLRDLLRLALKEEMLTKRKRSTTYHFAHERLQEAAYSLIPHKGNTRSRMHWRLGQLMKDKCQMYPDQHWMAYLAADQLNRGLVFVNNKTERVELARINLQVSELSQERSAFYPATEFIRKAIVLLAHDDDKKIPVSDDISVVGNNANVHRIWKEHYQLCVDLYSSLAEMEYLLGNHDSARNAVDDLIKHAKTEGDKFRAQVILIESISAERDFDLAIDTCLKFLANAYDMQLPKSPGKLQIMAEKTRVNSILDKHAVEDENDKSEVSGGPTLRRRATADAAGKKLPENASRFKPTIPVNATRGLRKVKTAVQNTTSMFRKQEKMLLTLPRMTDETSIRVSKLLSQLMLNAILSGKTELSAYIGLRSIRYSFQHGISAHSPMALAAYGISQAREGKLNAAYANGMLALKLLNATDCKEWYTRTVLKCYNLRHIKRPFHESLDPLMDAYKAGIESGDLEYALMSAMQYSLIYMFIGLPVAPLESDLIAFAEQVQRYHLPPVLETTFYIYHNYILDLQGVDHDPIVLEDITPEESKSFTSSMFRDSSSSNSASNVDRRSRPIIEREICLVEMQRAYLFGELEKAEKQIHRLSELPKQDFSVVRTLNRDTSIALVYFKLARSTGKKKYRTDGEKIMKEFESNVKNGSINCHHVLKLLQAEDAACAFSGDVAPVTIAYDTAITSCARSGFTIHEALSNELAGCFLAEKHVKSSEQLMSRAKAYMARAMALYDETGLKAKVEQLERRFPQLQPTRLMAGSNIKARRRYSRTPTARFRDMKFHSGRWSVGASSDLKVLDGFDQLLEEEESERSEN